MKFNFSVNSRFILFCLLVLGSLPSYAQSIELADFLKTYDSYPSKSYRILMNDEYEIIAREDNWISNPLIEAKGFGLGNRHALSHWQMLVNYLDANDFVIEEVSFKPGDYGDIFAFFSYKGKQWVVDFSCGSHGCGVEFSY